MNTEREPDRWCLRSWLWVFLCAAAIFATVPVARRIQGFVYNSVGREFFTYAVLSVIIAGLAAVLYFLAFRLRVRSISQYAWLFTGAGLYVYFTIQLRQHPEEAVHFLEYGALAYFLFRALSCRIRDRTIYMTVVLAVLFVGTLDEFIQWLIPKRYWDYRDVGINTLAGVFFSIIMWKGIRPETISRPVVRRLSIRILAGVITLDLLFLGLCLSNTPDAVRRYTAAFEPLMWLRGEEVMTEFGYAHKDPEIGTFYSRLTIGELREHDMKSSSTYNKLPVDEITSLEDYETLRRTYTRVTDPFMYEFLQHIIERDLSLDEFLRSGNQKSGLTAFKENLILEKYFGSTLRYFNAVWSREKRDHFKDSQDWLKKNYTGGKGKMITSFSLKTAWLFIIVILAVVWTAGELWRMARDCRRCRG
ncbi:MAG: VanZ family protein [Deferribacteres bacterium]|nr:VanZ family protein [Deferribacteres bacterium]